jgi:hypothetical protein
MRCKEHLHALQRTFTCVAKNIYMRCKENLHALQRKSTCVAMHFDNVTIHFDNLTFNIYIRYKAF